MINRFALTASEAMGLMDARGGRVWGSSSSDKAYEDAVASLLFSE